MNKWYDISDKSYLGKDREQLFVTYHEKRERIMNEYYTFNYYKIENKYFVSIGKQEDNQHDIIIAWMPFDKFENKGN